MEAEVSEPKPSAAMAVNDRVLVKRKTLQAVLLQCQRALELLESNGGVALDDDEEGGDDAGSGSPGEDRRCGEEEEVYFLLPIVSMLLIFSKANFVK